MKNPLVWVVIALLALVVGLNSVFTVDEREWAIKLRLGEIIRSDFEPGLQFMVPFVNNVFKIERRIQTLDARPEPFLTAELKNLDVDFFVKWRVSDPARYYVRTSGDTSRANALLLRVILDGLRAEFGRRTIQEAVSGERADIMSIVTRNANAAGEDYGISVIDVRIKRIDLPEDVSESVHRRMRSDRERIASLLRAEGSESAERIRADADRQVTVLLAEARRDAERTRGEGDAEAAAIFARAHTRNSEFYSFYRSLQAYRDSIGQGTDLLLIAPDSRFFRYLRESTPRQ